MTSLAELSDNLKVVFEDSNPTNGEPANDDYDTKEPYVCVLGLLIAKIASYH